MLRLSLTVLAAGSLALVPDAAQKRSAKDAASQFSLDPSALSGDQRGASAATVPDEAAPPATSIDPKAATDAATTSEPSTTPDPSATTDAAAAPEPAANAPIVTTLGPPASLDTPIEQLIANPRTRAVLDKDLPGLSTDQNLVRFQKLSLRKFQPLTGGQMTMALLNQVGADLAALDEKATGVLAPTAVRKAGRRPSGDVGR